MATLCHCPLHQLDIKNVFLYGDLDGPLQGFNQSPCAWFGKFNYIVQIFGLKHNEPDYLVFLLSYIS